MSKRQFRAPASPRTFFDRKIQRYGYSRMIALGKVIPKHWRYVRVSIQRQDDNSLVLLITKLMGDPIDAQSTKANSRSGCDT